MIKFIHITDTHLVARGQALYGLDPRWRLQACLDDIRRRHPDATACVITGDLAHEGHAEAYAQLAELVSDMPMPVYPILGNHDHRERFLNACGHLVSTDGSFVQYSRLVGGHRAVFLDTNEPGVHFGVFCERRAQWLSETLATSREPVLLFMHHPPFDLGLPFMDSYRLLEASPFMQAIEPHRKRLRHMFFGHVHRPVSGCWQGLPFSSIRGTNHQLELELNQTPSLIFNHEAPQYAVVLLADQSAVVHIHDFLDRSDRFDAFTAQLLTGNLY